MVKEDMSSPLGHALAGVAAAWSADLIPGARGWRTAKPTASLFDRAGGTLTAVCAGLAVLPDVDLVFQTYHRSMTHSFTAVATVMIVSAVVTRWVTRHSKPDTPNRPLPIIRIALMCGAAYGTHLLVDWLSVDLTPPYGIQAFWPFSHKTYLSGLNLFPRTERRVLYSLETVRVNLFTMAWEAVVFLPIVGLLWLVREKALARFAAELPAGDHAPQ